MKLAVRSATIGASFRGRRQRATRPGFELGMRVRSCIACRGPRISHQPVRRLNFKTTQAHVVRMFHEKITCISPMARRSVRIACPQRRARSRDFWQTRAPLRPFLPRCLEERLHQNASPTTTPIGQNEIPDDTHTTNSRVRRRVLPRGLLPCRGARDVHRVLASCVLVVLCR